MWTESARLHPFVVPTGAMYVAPRAPQHQICGVQSGNRADPLPAERQGGCPPGDDAQAVFAGALAQSATGRPRMGQLQRGRNFPRDRAASGGNLGPELPGAMRSGYGGEDLARGIDDSVLQFRRFVNQNNRTKRAEMKFVFTRRRGRILAASFEADSHLPHRRLYNRLHGKSGGFSRAARCASACRAGCFCGLESESWDALRGLTDDAACSNAGWARKFACS